MNEAIYWTPLVMVTQAGVFRYEAPWVRNTPTLPPQDMMAYILFKAAGSARAGLYVFNDNRRPVFAIPYHTLVSFQGKSIVKVIRTPTQVTDSSVVFYNGVEVTIPQGEDVDPTNRLVAVVEPTSSGGGGVPGSVSSVNGRLPDSSTGNVLVRIQDIPQLQQRLGVLNDQLTPDDAGKLLSNDGNSNSWTTLQEVVDSQPLTIDLGEL